VIEILVDVVKGRPRGVVLCKELALDRAVPVRHFEDVNRRARD
jgi:hypothetical protein